MVRRAGPVPLKCLGKMRSSHSGLRKVVDIQQFGLLGALVTGKEKARIAAGSFRIWLLDLGSNQGPTD